MLTPEDLKFLEVNPDFISCQFVQWVKVRQNPLSLVFFLLWFSFQFATLSDLCPFF